MPCVSFRVCEAHTLEPLPETWRVMAYLSFQVPTLGFRVLGFRV